MVPIGAGGRLELETKESPAPPALLGTVTDVSADLAQGTVSFTVIAGDAKPDHEVRATVGRHGRTLASSLTPLATGEQRLDLTVEDPELWWPCGEGTQPLYDVEVAVTCGGQIVREWTRRVGFKRVEWRPCAGAPVGALPWLCIVNGRAIFLQGVNWTPVRMGYMDTTIEEIERLVSLYEGMGCNLLRVWGGGHLETPEFYAACDRAGLMVWQEFPLSSSGIDSSPPSAPEFVAELVEVARHYLRSRQHHACLLMWCGGNELHHDELFLGGKRRIPLTLEHPALTALAALVSVEDPCHRFLPTSPYGPRFHSVREEFGQGLHHEVHGPWGLDGHLQPGEWEAYWRDDDALFRGETGVAGASSLALIRRYAGGEATWPPGSALWQHSSGWWTQANRLGARFASLSGDDALAAYVEFTRREQAEKLACAVRAKKAQFPRCGGFLIWMGHDAFPCLANTSLIEFDHRLKPAAHAIAAVFHTRPGSLS